MSYCCHCKRSNQFGERCYVYRQSNEPFEIQGFGNPMEFTDSAHCSPGIEFCAPTDILIKVPGIYEMVWTVSAITPNQFAIQLQEGQEPAIVITNTTYGQGVAPSTNIGQALVKITEASEENPAVIDLVNACSGLSLVDNSSQCKEITVVGNPKAGGCTQTVQSSLLIKQVGDLNNNKKIKK